MTMSVGVAGSDLIAELIEKDSQVPVGRKIGQLISVWGWRDYRASR
jgi:hypothetical protein